MSHTLAHRLLDHAVSHPAEPAFAVFPRGGHAAPLDTITWREWSDRSQDVGAALIASGLKPGDHVLIFADNVPLWPIVDLGVLLARGVSVGAYPTSAPEQIVAQLLDCSARIVFVDTRARQELLTQLGSRIPWPLTVVCDDDPATALPTARLEHRAALRDGIAHIALDDDALLIYTSGSTGVPKGARISHRYLSASAASIAETLQLTANDSGMAFLPFCHAAERVFGLYVRLHVRMCAVLVEAPDDVWNAARVFEPTLFAGLPRLYEKLGDAIAPATDVDSAREILASYLGTRCRLATSGGATLPPAVAQHLQRVGLTVLGAYGQTEHLCVAMNRPDAFRFDAVGRPMPGTEIRIADDGELLVRRGDLTFSGYFGKAQATREAFTDDGAWLRTGDLAAVDRDGMLRLTGRRKELIALSNGKKVAPLPVEADLTASPLIAGAMCHGEGRHFLTAVLAVDEQAVSALASMRGVHGHWPAVAHDPAVLAAVQAHVDTVNATRSRPEQVRAFAVTTDTWAVTTGELTPTLKIRRAVVSERYAALLAALYAGSAQ